MGIEEIVAKLLEADLKGEEIHHYYVRLDTGNIAVLTVSPSANPRHHIFKHHIRRDTWQIPNTVSLIQAIGIVKEYWDERIEK
jgi:hypothetical protein